MIEQLGGHVVSSQGQPTIPLYRFLWLVVMLVLVVICFGVLCWFFCLFLWVFLRWRHAFIYTTPIKLCTLKTS